MTPRAHEQVNILLVDDQPGKLLSYEAVLSDLGENLVKVGSAREALDCLLRTDFAVILIDVCMPEFDGFDLVAMIREHPRFDTTAIILVSAVFMSDDDRLLGYQRGAMDYVSVPIVPEILRAKVAAFADLYRKNRQLERLNEELERRVAERTAELETSLAMIQANEARLRLAVEGVGLGTWNADLRTGRAVCSPSFFGILGRAPAEDGASLNLWLELIHPEDREAIRREMETARVERALFSPDHRIVRADTGDVAWLSIFGRFLYDAAGDANRFVGVFFDITQRKLAERRSAAEHEMTLAMAAASSLEEAAPAMLQAVGRHFDAVFASLWLFDESSPSLRCAGAEQIGVDAELTVFAETSRGLTFEIGQGLPGRAWQDARPVLLKEVVQSGSFARTQPAAGAGLAAGVAFPILSGGRVVCVIEYFSRSPLAQERLLLDTITALGSGIGRIVERKQLETGLRASEERLSLAVAAGAVATWTWDVNADRLHGDERLASFMGITSEEAARGVSLTRFLAAVHEEDRARVTVEVAQAAESGSDFAIECRVQTAQRPHWIRISGRVERDGAGRAVRLPGAVVDITDFMRMEQQLREAAESKDLFLAMLAHELRNPLAPIRNAVQIMRLQELGDPTLRWCRDMIGRQTDQLTRLVDDLLDVSRITQGKIKLCLEPLDLVAIAAQAVETSRPVISARRHNLSISVPDQSVWVIGDSVRLNQVITNLLTNAAKYQDEGGRISLAIERSKAHALIRVTDHGIGIEPEMIGRVFELFMQVEGTVDRAHGGLGIGLSLVKTLAELHGGSVRATSGGRGKGSEFVVTLPCQPEGPVSTAVKAAGASGHQPPQRILVVDDNRDSAESLAKLLRLSQHQVSIAYDGQQALQLYFAELPSAVFLDIDLPDTSGLEVCRRIRAGNEGKGAAPSGPPPLVVAMTGYGQEIDKRRSRESGFDAHLTKPVDFNQLLQLLARSTPRGPQPSAQQADPTGTQVERSAGS